MMDFKLMPGGYAEARKDYDAKLSAERNATAAGIVERALDKLLSGVDRAVANSPPPLSDVGDDVSFMMDEGMGMMKGDEYVKNCPHGGPLCWSAFSPTVEAGKRCDACPYKEINMNGEPSTEALLNERQKTHGSFAQNATYGQVLRDLFRDSDGWKSATPREREALDYIAGKLARILSGRPDHADHWDDIAGYAKLALQR